jgi:ATPase subunit of ABC transporter with duplicated ATPase domains
MDQFLKKTLLQQKIEYSQTKNVAILSMSTFALKVTELCPSETSRSLLDPVEISLDLTKKYALIGRNGSGKSTLLKYLKSVIPGARAVDQHSTFPSTGTLLDFVIQSDSERVALLAEKARLETRLEDDYTTEEDDPLLRIVDIQKRLTEIKAYCIEERGISTLKQMGFTETQMHSPPSILSGGWKKKCSLVCALFSRPTFLLLDEPANHLDSRF